MTTVQVETSPAKLELDRFGILVRAPKPFDPGFTITMKELGGRYDANYLVWRFPSLRWMYKWLQEVVPRLEVADTVHQLFQRRPITPLEHPSKYYEKLYQYQKDAVQYLVDYQSALIALSPGLGKTAVSLVTADSLDLKSLLVVAPLSLLHTWTDECALWTDRTMGVAYGILPPTAEGWWVTNYDTFADQRNAYKILSQYRFDVVILDESVHVKGRNTQRVKALLNMRPTFRRIWLLSGSPITRYYDDLWSQFHLIKPDAFTSYWRFAERYCKVEKTQWSPQPIVKGSNLHMDIRDDFADLMFVRHQKDVLPDLPDFIHQTIDVLLTPPQRTAHDEMKRKYLTELKEGKTIRVRDRMTQLTRLQQITSNLINLDHEDGGSNLDISAKADAIMEMVPNGAVEFPVLIWTHWVPGARALQTRLKKAKIECMVLTGETPMSTREFWLDKFDKEELPVIIISMGVGKYGLNELKKARTVFYVDKTWDADAYIQSLYRVKRLGLDHRPVVYNLKARKTVDELVELNLEGKLPGIATVSDADLVELLEGL